MNEEKMSRVAEDQKRMPGLEALNQEKRAAQHEMIVLLTGKVLESSDERAEFKRVNDRMEAARVAIIKFMAGMA